MFVDAVRYDEATNLLSTWQVHRLQQAARQPGDASGAELQQQQPETNPLVGFRESVESRVFQTEAVIGALVKVIGPCEDVSYQFITSDVITAPQLLQRSTAECIATSFGKSSAVRWLSSGQFPFAMRMITTDRCAAQWSAERMIQRTHACFHRLHFPCEIHMHVTALNRALALADESISGIIRIALSLRLGGWMKIFRQELCNEIQESLDVRIGRSSASAARRRRIACTIFTGGQRRTRLIQSIMGSLPNGDWQDQSSVQVYISPGTDISHRELANTMCDGLLKSLAGAQFRIFNRSRWTQNDDAVCRLGLLEACHGLLRRSFTRWLRKVGFNFPSRPPADPNMELSQPVAPADVAMLADDGEGSDDQPADARTAEPDAGLGHDGEPGIRDAPPAAADSEAAPQTGDHPDFAEINRKNREMAYRWVSNRPLRDLVLIRLIMEPSMAVIRKLLEVSGEAWMKQQLTRSLYGNGDPVQDFRMLFAARGDLETQLFAHIQMLLFATLVALRLWDSCDCDCDFAIANLRAPGWDVGGLRLRFL